MVDFENVPEYYKPEFKGRKPKYCPVHKTEMEYDGWGSDSIRIDEFWFCKKCNKSYKNPE